MISFKNPFATKDKEPQIDFISTREGLDEIMPIIPAREYQHEWIKRAARDFRKEGSLSSHARKENASPQNPNDPTDMSNYLVINEDADVRHVMKCPGIFALKNMGWILRAHTEFKIQILNDGAGYKWTAPMVGAVGWLPMRDDTSGLITHHPEQNLYNHMANWPKNSMQKILKFNMPWFARIPEGYELVVVHPYYLDDWRFTCLPGIFDPDYGLAGMALPILWHDKEGEHIIKAGTPLAQMFLVPKEVKQMKHTNTNTTEDNEARKQMNLTGLNMRVKFKQDYPMARKFWQKYWKKIGWYKKDTKVSTKENLLDD